MKTGLGGIVEKLPFCLLIFFDENNIAKLVVHICVNSSNRFLSIIVQLNSNKHDLQVLQNRRSHFTKFK